MKLTIRGLDSEEHWALCGRPGDASAHMAACIRFWDHEKRQIAWPLRDRITDGCGVEIWYGIRRTIFGAKAEGMPR